MVFIIINNYCYNNIIDTVITPNFNIIMYLYIAYCKKNIHSISEYKINLYRTFYGHGRINIINKLLLMMLYTSIIIIITLDN